MLLSYTFDSIHVENDLLYELENASDAGSYAAGIKVFDVSDPEHVRQLTRLRIGNRYYNYLIDENIIYIAAGESLVIAEISKDTGLQKLAEWRSLGDLDWIEANANQLFALNDLDHRIYQFEVDSAQTLRLLHEYKHDQMYIDQAVLSGNAVFTTGWWAGIHRFQTDVIPWQETADFDSPNRIETVSGMITQGDYLYAITDGVLTVLDISDPLQLPQTGKFEQLASSYSSLTVDNEQLFIWARFRNGHRFQIISIADPTMPEEIGIWQDPLQAQVKDLVAHNNLVYLLTSLCSEDECNGETLLRIVDVTDAANMTVIATLPIAGNATNVTLLDDQLLLGGDKIRLVDISNSAQPQLIGELATPGYALDAVEYNGLIYVADGAGGLLVLRLAE